MLYTVEALAMFCLSQRVIKYSYQQPDTLRDVIATVEHCIPQQQTNQVFVMAVILKYDQRQGFQFVNL